MFSASSVEAEMGASNRPWALPYTVIGAIGHGPAPSPPTRCGSGGGGGGGGGGGVFDGGGGTTCAESEVVTPFGCDWHAAPAHRKSTAAEMSLMLTHGWHHYSRRQPHGSPRVDRVETSLPFAASRYGTNLPRGGDEAT